ncbi:MAG: glycosyltransferase family 2 protein [Candidatus Omnitrophota bacterium]
MIHIIIPVHNRRELTRNCLACLKRQTFTDFKCVVINDGSSDGTGDMVRNEFPDVVLLSGDGNLWWTKSVNLGIKSVLPGCKKEDFILTLNDDVEIRDDFLANIVKCAGNNPGLLIGALAIDIKSGNITFPVMKNKGCKLPEGQEAIKMDMLVGRGMLIPVPVFEKIGFFDEALPQSAADEDFSINAKKAGFDLIVCAKSVVYANESKEEKMRLYIINPIEYAKWIFAIKNPFNIRTRYIFNRKHSRFWVVSFTRDLLIIFVRYFRNVFNRLLVIAGVKK